MMRLHYFIKQVLYIAKRKAYSLRLLVPGLRRLHKLEVIVGPRGYWIESRAYQVDALKRNGLQPEHRLLDFGCGPMQGGVGLIQYLEEGRYVGLDRSSRNLDAAYSELSYHRLAAKKPVLICSDDFGKEALRGKQFDVVWASQIICYFDNKILVDLFEHVAEILDPAGKFLFDILGECPPEFRSSGHVKWINSVNSHTIESIQSIAEPLGFMVRSVGKIEDYGYPKGLNLRSNILLELTRKPWERKKLSA